MPSPASSTAASHCAALRPKVVGTACWVSVRPAMTVSRWVRARPARWRPVVARSSRTRCIASRASSTRAVSSTSWLVSPRCTAAGSPPSATAASRSEGDQRDHGVAGELGVGEQRVEVGTEGARRPRDRVGRPVVGQPGHDERPRPRRLDPQHRGDQGRVVDQTGGAVGAGSEQPGHVACPGNRRKTVSPSPCSRTSNSKRPVVGAHDLQAAPLLLGQPVEEGVALPRQVRAGEQPVGEAAGEHGEREERRTAVDPGGFDRREVVAPGRIGRRPAPAGEPAVAAQRPLHLRHPAGGVCLPQLEQRVGDRVAVAVAHGAVQPDRPRRRGRDQLAAAVVRQRVVEERAHRLPGGRLRHRRLPRPGSAPAVWRGCR